VEFIVGQVDNFAFFGRFEIRNQTDFGHFAAVKHRKQLVISQKPVLRFVA
jgi:hypothetical protein